MRQRIDKFCIITAQRSGSAWLVSLLDSHAGIEAFYELFLHGLAQNKNFDRFHTFRKSSKQSRPVVTFKYLSKLDSLPGSHSTIGFKIMYNQLVRNPEVLAKLVLDRYKVIHLVRENQLDRVISSASMTQNGLVHSEKKVKANPVHLNTGSLVKVLSWQETQVKVARLLLKLMPFPVLEVTYQELHQNTAETLLDIVQFLGESPVESGLSSDRQKINRGSYQDKIENYDLVCKTLAGTRFEKYLQ